MQSDLKVKIDGFCAKFLYNIHYNFDLKFKEKVLIQDIFKDEDEVMVAREIRLNYPLLEVVEGQYICRKYPAERETGIEETLYIERLGSVRKSDFKDTQLAKEFSIYGSILDVYVDEKQLYGFIRFEDTSSVSAVLDNLNLRNRFKFMTKQRWNKLMQDYYNNYLTEKKRISDLKTNLKGSYGKLEYKPNIIGLVQNLNKNTNSKTIKSLLGMIVPVAYVDYQMKNTSCYVRFKNDSDAQLAATYFSRVSMTQSSGFDSVGVIGNADLCKRHYEMLRRGELVTGITLQILDGQDESDYWNGITQIQASLKSVGIDQDVEMEGTHLVFDDDGDILDLNFGTKHVIFEDSDNEQDPDPVEIKEKHRKKRHRAVI